MYLSLMPEMLGIKTTLHEAIMLAAKHGFAGVDASPGQLDGLSADKIARLREAFEATGTRPGYCSMPPGRIPVPEDQWQESVAALPRFLKTASDLGYSRSAYVLLPFHETLDRAAALDEHLTRLRQVAPIFADHGFRLGLEYVAAPTRRAPYAVHTVWNLAGTLELIDATGEPNLGLMLDTFHWHGAGETTADLLALRPEQVVVVHANDAPDLPLEEQTVMNRALPGATGVIDASNFYSALRAIGYEGPITCEPMASAVEALGAKDEDELVGAVRRALAESVASTAP